MTVIHDVAATMVAAKTAAPGEGKRMSMNDGHALGIAIDDGAVTSALVDIRSGEVRSHNQIPIAAPSELVAVLNDVVTSVPGDIRGISIACAAPSTQISLANLSRHPATVDPSAGDARPPWLERATIISTATALGAVVGRQFAGGGRVVVANIDAAGMPARIQPLMLVDPSARSVVDTVNLAPNAAQFPVTEAAGADALASAFTAFPMRGADVEMIALAGAGAGLPGLQDIVATAFGLPVRVLANSTYASAQGAALVARPARATKGARGSSASRRRRGLLLATVGAAVAVAAATIPVVMAAGGENRSGDAEFPAHVTSTDSSAASSVVISPSATSATSRSRTPSRTTTPTDRTPVEVPTTAAATTIATTRPEPVSPPRQPASSTRPAPTSRERPTSNSSTAPTRLSVPPPTRPTTSIHTSASPEASAAEAPEIPGAEPPEAG